MHQQNSERACEGRNRSYQQGREMKSSFHKLQNAYGDNYSDPQQNSFNEIYKTEFNDSVSSSLTAIPFGSKRGRPKCERKVCVRSF